MVEKLRLDEGSVCRWGSGSRHPSRWMAGRINALLKAIEGNGETASTEPALSFFDATLAASNLLTTWALTLGERLRTRPWRSASVRNRQAGRRFGVGRVTFYRWERVLPPPRGLRRKIRRFLSPSPGP
jgi:hypothetical protein